VVAHTQPTGRILEKGETPVGTYRVPGTGTSRPDTRRLVRATGIKLPLFVRIINKLAYFPIKQSSSVGCAWPSSEQNTFFVLCLLSPSKLFRLRTSNVFCEEILLFPILP
jgi:hypothetical protein